MSTIERIRGIAPEEIDGEICYPAEEVFRAMRLNVDKARRAIRAENKKRKFIYKRGYRSKFVWYITRGGVETLAILYGDQPRGEILAALRES